MIGLDTCFLIDATNKNTRSDITEPIAISDLALFEFFCGANKKDIEALQQIKENSTILNSSEHFEFAAEIWQNLRKQGKEIGKFDCLIAASYISNGINKILTRNKKHFENIPGIECIEY